jgi:hypothetical protein
VSLGEIGEIEIAPHVEDLVPMVVCMSTAVFAVVCGHVTCAILIEDGRSR